MPPKRSAIGLYLRPFLLALNIPLVTGIIFVLFADAEWSSVGVRFFLGCVYVLIPFVFSLLKSVDFFQGRTTNPAWSLAGIVSGAVASVVYFEAYGSGGMDNEGGLLFLVMPVCQLLLMLVLGYPASRRPVD